MEYTKERNFIVAYEGGVVQGKWNIIDGNFYGKKDKPVTSVPHAFTFDQLSQWGTNHDSWYYAKCVRTYRNEHSYLHYYNGALYEQVISLKLKFDSLYIFSEDASNISLTKDVVEYLKQEHNGYFKCSYVKSYLIKKQYKDFIDTLSEQSKNLFIKLFQDFPFEYLKTILNRMEKEHVTEYDNYGKLSNESMIRDYYNMCMEMYGAVKVEPNIVSNYIQICYLYKYYKEKNYNNILKKNNDKKFLYFENDEIIAFPLLSKEDFHKEAEAQHNCVERLYMDKVVNNETYIIAIRKKNNPETSYITCEIAHDGIIKQYLLGCNRSPINDSAAIHFKFHYQNYIYQHLKEA